MDVKLQEWLKNYQIAYNIYTHPAVFTVEEAKLHCGHIPGMKCKNLFLKDVKGRNYFLVTIPAMKKLDFDQFAKIVNLPVVKFANDEELQGFLGLSKGAVSPLGLINDENNKVLYLIDKDVWTSEIVTFHPNINTETLELTQEAYQLLVKCTGNKFQIIEY